MLNRFRIGTKLTLGFVSILFLLAVVWQVGRWAIVKTGEAMDNIDVAEDLAKDGLTMGKEINDMLIDSKKLIITREKQYSDSIQKRVVALKNAGNDMLPRILAEENKKRLNDILAEIDKFAASESSYWTKETERTKEVENRRNAAEIMIDSLEKLKEGIHGITKEQFAITQEEQVFYAAKRINLEQEVYQLSNTVRDIRRMCYEYEIESDTGERKKLMDKMTAMDTQIGVKIEEMSQQLQTPQGHIILKELRESAKAWWKLVEKTAQLEDELTTIDKKSEEITDTILAQLETLIGEYEKRATNTLDSARGDSELAKWILFGTSIFAIFAGLIISYVLTANIKLGIGKAVGALTTIANDGIVSIEIPPEDLNRKDEIGDLAVSVGAILHQFQNVERLANDLAAGNYRIETKVRGDQDTMNINLNKMLDQVNHALREINETVKQVANGSGEVSSAAQSLSSGAQEAAASLEEITASMNEISSQTRANAESATQARDLAHKASTAAANGQQAMQEMTDAMGRITQNSSEIQRVIKVIDDIAFQTNLLALNAAVEAARAGQHGKGFAVVAEEVRNLASRSAKAAQETSELIAKSGQEIEKGASVATRTADVLNTIVEQVRQTTDLVAGIAVASNEQAEGVNQVTVGLQQIDAVTQQNTASAEESASAAGEMSSMAANLQKLVDQFQLR